MAATFLASGSGSNSAVFTLAVGDISVPNTVWANLDAAKNRRIKALLDATYASIAAFLSAAAASGLDARVQTGTAALTNAFWTCAPGAKPVLNFAAVPADGGYARISMSYSNSR